MTAITGASLVAWITVALCGHRLGYRDKDDHRHRTGADADQVPLAVGHIVPLHRGYLNVRLAGRY